MLQKSWDLRRKHAVYDHEAFLHLEAAKKAVAGPEEYLKQTSTGKETSLKVGVAKIKESLKIACHGLGKSMLSPSV